MFSTSAIFRSPAFLALLVTLLFIPFVPDLFDRYEAEVLEKERLHKVNEGARKERFRFFKDLDRDGFSECIDLKRNERFSAIRVKGPKGGIQKQLNLPPPDTFARKDPRLNFCDTDKDSAVEIHYVARKEDSLFLQTLDPYGEERPVQRHFLDSIHYRTKKGYAANPSDCECHDLQKDGKKELILAVTTGFSLQPRALYAFDQFGENIRRTPKSGAHFQRFTLFDLDDDGGEEVLLQGTNAYANTPLELEMPYRDTSAWLMAFDQELDPLFEPVEFPPFNSFLRVAPYKEDGEARIAALYQYRGKRDKEASLHAFDGEGVSLDQRPLPGKKKTIDRRIFSTAGGERLYLKDRKSIFRRVSTDLELSKAWDPPFEAIKLLKQLDLDEDGRKELIFFDEDEGSPILITRSDLSHPVMIEVPSNKPDLGKEGGRLSLKRTRKGELHLSVQNGPEWFLIDYRSNPLYYFKYGVYGGIYALLFLFIYLVQKAATYKLERDKKKLEAIVAERTAELEEKNKAITDSIDYAQKIQNALLQSDELISAKLPEHFILFKPQAQVSGDFYWAKAHKGYFYIAAVDCTGHGVPGAFMSMLGISQLNEVMSTEEVLTPGEILTDLRERVVRELSGSDPEQTAKDGMDAAIVRVPISNTNSNSNSNSKGEGLEVQFAGAQNPLYVIRKGIAEEPPSVSMEYRGESLDGDPVKPFRNNADGIEIKGDGQPVGYDEYAKDAFTTVKLQLRKGDMCYIFSDGYADQFGGVKGKKFRYRPFKELLVRVHEKALEEQKQQLDRTFEDWKEEGGHEQIDDVVVIGVRV